MTAGQRFKLAARTSAVKAALRDVAAWTDADLDAMSVGDLAGLEHAAAELTDSIEMLIGERKALQRTDAQLLDTLARIATIGGTVDVRA
jgi:hypothetical protein